MKDVDINLHAFVDLGEEGKPTSYEVYLDSLKVAKMAVFGLEYHNTDKGIDIFFDPLKPLFIPNVKAGGFKFTSKKAYWGHIFWMPGVPVPMKFILAPIELLGVLIKPFALMIRLYANMTAGHIVIMSLIGLLYVFTNWFAKGAFLGLTLFLSIIELLVAFLQAYIFTMLTALYFGGAVAEHDEH